MTPAAARPAQDDAHALGGRDAFDDASVPVAGRLWRAAAPGPLWWVAVALAVGVVAWVVLLGGWAIRAARGGEPLGIASGAAVVGWLLVAVGGVPVMALVWMAELKRRGRVRRSPDARGRVLPVGSNVARVRLLSPRWHVAWLVLVGALAVTQVVVASDGRWFADGDDGGFGVLWAFTGLVAAGVFGALLGSLLKKVCFRLGGGARSPGSAFWRWFAFRWRFDLWSCAVGTAALAAAFFVARVMATRPADDTSTASDLAQAHDVVRVLSVAGGVLVLGGLAAATQFRRAGRDIATSESVA